MNNFSQRTLTGIVYVLLVVTSLFIHPFVFATLLLMVNILATLEFYKIILGNNKLLRICGLITSVLIYACLSLIFFNIIQNTFIFLIMIFVFLSFLPELFSKSESPYKNIATLIFGFIYISIPLSLMNLLFNYSFQTNIFIYEILLGYFIILWVNDTFAYLTGLVIGQHKLFERVSPKKTWEGSIGGFVFSMIAAYLISLFFYTVSILDWFVIAFIIVVFGTFGDLIESLLKRSSGCKDSGKILPGHGGVLDRFDSILFSVPFVVAYLLLLKKIL